MGKKLIVAASVSGFFAVLCGALGAHALESRLADSLPLWHTAVEYHFYHSLVLLWVGSSGSRYGSHPGLVSSGICFLAGMVLFSGSLYGYALSSVKLFAMMAPVGGLLLMAGWLLLAWAVWSQETDV